MPRTAFPRLLRKDLRLREVAPHLYVGDEDAGRLHIWSAVIDVGGEGHGRERAVAQANLEHRMTWWFDDGKPIPAGLLDAAHAMSRHVLRQNEDVLVHCMAGLSRSASVAYALLRTIYRLDHDAALLRVKTPSEPDFPHHVVIESARKWADRRSAKIR